MIRVLHVIAIIVATYATILFARSNGLIQVRIFGFDGSLVPRWAAWLAHVWGMIFFYVGSFLLLKGYRSGRMKSIEIMSTKIQITDTNRDIVVRGIWFTCIGLVASLGVILIPTKLLGISHVEIGSVFVIGVLTSFLPSMWTLRAIKSAEQVAASDR